METYRSDPDPITYVKPAPEASGRFEANGHGLYWERYGLENERTVLLLHHGLGSIEAWSGQIGALVAADWHVIAYDRWGYGRSDARPQFEESFLQHDADEALQLLQSLNLEKINIVGHSDGGTIALMLASECPQWVERMAVVAVHIYIEPKIGPGLAEIAQSIDNPAFVKALSRQHGQKAEAMARAWVDRWQRMGPQELDIQHLLPNIECPTLVIQGAQDELATAQHAYDIADGVQNGRVWLIPGVGHMPPHEVPEIFNQMVLGFLESESLTTETTSPDI